MFDLVVKSPVAGYQRGERISDRAVVDKILAGEERAHVVKVPALGAAAPSAHPPSGEHAEDDAH